MIGICSNWTNKNSRFFMENGNIAYWGDSGLILTSTKDKDYGSKFDTNNIIEMELNLIKKILIFYVNGVSQGIAINNLLINNSINYRLAITMFSPKCSVSIIKFKKIYKLE